MFWSSLLIGDSLHGAVEVVAAQLAADSTKMTTMVEAVASPLMMEAPTAPRLIHLRTTVTLTRMRKARIGRTTKWIQSLMVNWRVTLSSWDCKHFNWKNCPVRLAGQHKGRSEGGKKTLILETIADPDLYLWSIFFGEAGSLNDINVLDKSSIVTSILNGKFDLIKEEYMINGRFRDWLYFLVDGVYPNWLIFIKSVRYPVDEIESHFLLSVMKLHAKMLKGYLVSWFCGS
jgi:hypothetical protein